MRSTAMVFRGSGQVLGAYTANDMPAWAICNGKDIMFASEDTDMAEGEASLREALEMLKRGGSKAIFTLRVYELEGKAKILSNTPYPRAIPFTVFDDEDELAPYDQRRRGYMREVEERLQAQDKQIAELKIQLEEAEDEAEAMKERPKGINGFLAGVMESPQGQAMFWNVVGAIVSKIVPMQNGPPGSAAVAGIDEPPPHQQQEALTSVLEPGQPEKVQQAINVLCAKDPKLGDHLLAVAGIAWNDANRYNFLISMLK
jgi:hypothetical protein